MNKKNPFQFTGKIMKNQVHRYAWYGLSIALASIVVATMLAAYQLHGHISLAGIIEAQKTNPALWALNITPFFFAYWGQYFFYKLMLTAEGIIGDQAKEFQILSHELEMKLQFETNHDSLTNLPNRRYFVDRIKQATAQVSPHYQVVVVVLNINDFKKVNYMVGSFNANAILKQFGERIKSSLLDPLLLNHFTGACVVARLQGDEFGIVFPKMHAHTDLEEFLANLVQLTSTYFMVDGMNIYISSTAGLAASPTHSDKAEELVHFASVAAFKAQRTGKDYLLYQADLDTTDRRIMLIDLRKALDRHELEIYYQPEIDLNSGKIIGAEALIRLDSDKYGVLHAEKMIPLIENMDIIRTWTKFTLKEAIQQLYLWHQEDRKITMTVNISAMDAADRHLPDFIMDLLNEKRIDPEYLCLELTERACLTYQARTKPVLERLAQLGVKISIEDFCSGYTSFMYLTHFPIHWVKIEKSYVMNMMDDPAKLTAVKAMLKLTQELGLHAMAVGINNQDIYKRLIKLGYHYGQGYLFSAPVKPEEFNSLFFVDLLADNEL